MAQKKMSGDDNTMITTIVVDTPRTSYEMPSPLMQTIDSMRVFASPLLHKLLVVFDGIQVKTRNTPKCAKPVHDKHAYDAYRTRVAQFLDERNISATIIVSETRSCFAGILLQTLPRVNTSYVAVIQNDLPLRKHVPLSDIVATMKMYPMVQKVHFTNNINSCHIRQTDVICVAHRHYPRTHPVLHARKYLVEVTPVRIWFDGNHIATLDHYKRISIFFKSGFFPEQHVFCKPYENHSRWGTYLLGPSGDGKYSVHLNGGNSSHNGCM